jgi:hypothetical protein
MTSRHYQQRTLTLLELFVQSSGSLHARSLLQIDEELLPMWHTSMLTYITLIGMVIGFCELSCLCSCEGCQMMVTGSCSGTWKNMGNPLLMFCSQSVVLLKLVYLQLVFNLHSKH